MPNNNLKTFETTVNIDVPTIIEEEHLAKVLQKVCQVITELLQKENSIEVDFDRLGPDVYIFNLSIITNDQMRELNNKYRQKDKSTDVLSFPIHENLREEQQIISAPGAPCLLGDIFICYDIAVKQANENGIDVETELVELFIHGVLHLFGYDHEISKTEADIMYQLEEKIFNVFKEKL